MAGLSAAVAGLSVTVVSVGVTVVSVGVTAVSVGVTVVSVALGVGVTEIPAGRYVDLAWSVAEFLVAFGAAYAVGRWGVEPLAERTLDAWRVDRTAANALLKILHVAVLVAALRVALDVADYGYLLSLPPTVVAALTVAVGFASRDIASNLVGGVFIVTDPEFNIGDWIRWNDREGVIEDISFRVTRVRTFDNELLTVPNSQLATSAVVNAVAKSPRRVSHTLHVDADADLGRVASVLVTEAEGHEEILERPTPTARVVELDDGRAGMQARFWIDSPSRETFVTVKSEYLGRVSRRLASEGIDLPREQN
ncbi:mechanosensitive ion channel family protein [Halorussus salilacus]|uniref:mechanosensitive ion channel family protein n=1 Tax=Halorussus salilacus TaxID=2953750 RepID=UPI00209EB738|nr:mechanosensitive ion channel family protein [Halorussus salilacus]USZ66975.1 mechanosensitive ion channel family protein [Halorussus salilacus]